MIHVSHTCILLCILGVDCGKCYKILYISFVRKKHDKMIFQLFFFFFSKIVCGITHSTDLDETAASAIVQPGSTLSA